MAKALRILAISGGIFITIVSLTHISLGHSWLPDTMEVNASIDSEHRFYTSLFLVYGLTLLWCSNDLQNRRPTFYVLLLALFVGGLARIVSLAVHGWPHPMFVVLGVLELVVPPIVWRLSESTFQPHES